MGLPERGLKILDLLSELTLTRIVLPTSPGAFGQPGLTALDELLLPTADRVLADLVPPGAAIEVSPDKTLSTIRNLSSSGMAGGCPSIAPPTHEPNVTALPQIMTRCTLNKAIHVIATTRMRSDPTTRAYVARRSAEGKSTKEIRRCLKRYIARQLYRSLTAAMSPATLTT